MLTTQPAAPKLAKSIGLNVPLYLKREDQHPLGSHKGRSIPPMIDYYAKQGVKNFVISSSGNAALAAGLHLAKKPKLKLTIFVGKNIEKNKLKTLQSVISTEAGGRMGKFLSLQILKGIPPLPRHKVGVGRNDNQRITIKQVANPKQAAFLMDKKGEAKNLRQSTDDTALIGYEQLARELTKIKKLSAVFIPTSSGTAAQGLYEGFKKLKLNPQIHIVQTEACHPMVSFCHPELVSGSQGMPKHLLAMPLAKPWQAGVRHNTSMPLASAIVDKVAHRKPQILKILKNSRGAGWVASDDDIKKTITLLRQSAVNSHQSSISPNSALSLVGLTQAIQSGWKFNGPVVCLFTGQ